jgi:hypothetical protein
MKETAGVRRKHKYRKSAAPSYPSESPPIPSAIDVSYLQPDQEVLAKLTKRYGDQIVTSQTIYKPGLLALSRVTFRGTRWQIRFQREVSKVIPFPDAAQIPQWEQNLIEEWDSKNARAAAAPGCLYAVHKNSDFSVTRFESLQDDFIQFLVSTETLELSYNPYLKVLRRADESEDNFCERCLEQIRQNFDQEMKNVDDSTLMQQERLREQLERELRERSENQMEDPALLMSDPAISSLKREVASLERMRETKREELEENFANLSRQHETDLVRLHRSDVEVIRMALVWLPYTEFVIQEADSRRVEIVQSF